MCVRLTRAPNHVRIGSCVWQKWAQRPSGGRRLPELMGSSLGDAFERSRPRGGRYLTADISLGHKEAILVTHLRKMMLEELQRGDS
jgi:hypothetical protein